MKRSPPKIFRCGRSLLDPLHHMPLGASSVLWQKAVSRRNGATMFRRLQRAEHGNQRRDAMGWGCDSGPCGTSKRRTPLALLEATILVAASSRHLRPLLSDPHLRPALQPRSESRKLAARSRCDHATPRRERLLHHHRPQPRAGAEVLPRRDQPVVQAIQRVAGRMPPNRKPRSETQRCRASRIAGGSSVVMPSTPRAARR